jgi:tetraprenyl-beta-curcumene synthase
VSGPAQPGRLPSIPARPPSIPARPPKPAPISLRQICVTGHAVARELTWTLPLAAREVRRWRKLAARIPDPAIRSDALASFEYKRVNIDGAALFCILSHSRDPRLLRLLVAYQILWDFLDSMNERGADRGTVNGRHLHRALADALDPALPISDYYRYHPWYEDGGYLCSLVSFCRRECALLPSYEAVRSLVLREADRAQVLAINHDPNDTQRDRELRRWARREFPTERRASWFELTAAASAGLTIFALLAAATKPRVHVAELEQVRRAYNPWISATATMLDSYVDRSQDVTSGEHSYVSHYPPTATALCVGELVRRATLEAAALSDGERHVLIVTSMTAMYLSNDRARSAAMRNDTRTLIRAGGPLAGLLLPVLRLWRLAYAQRSS